VVSANARFGNGPRAADGARRDSTFSWSDEQEPHVERRRLMLLAHPEIRDLFGPCPRSKYIVSALVAVQLAAAYLLRDASWWAIVLVGYVFGGVVNHALPLAIHELAHNLAFRARSSDNWGAAGERRKRCNENRGSARRE